MALLRPRARTHPTTLNSPQFRAVIAMSLLIMAGFGVIVPALPLFAQRFGAGEAGIGLVVFAFSLTRLFGDFFAGGLIDRFGERAMTAIGAFIVGVSSIAAGAAANFTQLVVLRGLGGFGSAFFLGGLMAYVIGTSPPDERGRAMSIFQGSFGLGFLVGPLIGGVILAVSTPNMPLYVYGVVCIVCVPLALRAMGPERVPSAALAQAPPLIEEHAPAPRAPAWRRLRPLLASPAYRAALAASAVMFLVGQAQFTLIPTFWQDVLGQAKAGSGIPFAVASLAGLVVLWHAGGLTDRLGRRATMIPSLAVSAASIVAIGFTGSAALVVVLMGIGGVAGGYLRPGPTAIVADLSTPESRGVAVSGYRIAGDVGALIGPVLAGVVAQYVSYRMAFVAIGATAAAAFLMTLVAEETAPRRTEG